ncbi:MAG TPA: DUF4232 domain-containing protein [Mycobacteriales bacterium]|nr:DUF4232 domain-containing protein [Mycobacteriales bacterium]
MTARVRLASLAVAALAAAGCSNGSSGGGDNTAATSPPTTASPTTSASASASPSPSESPTPTPSFSSTVQASHGCGIGALKVTVGQGQGAAGSTIIPIVFTNDSSRPCTLFGYPGVSFLDSGGHQLGQPADERGGEKAIVTLAPGSAANAQLQIPEPGNFSAADCKVASAAFLRVYPPGEKRSVQLAESAQVCTTEAGRSVVLPVAPGTGG